MLIESYKNMANLKRGARAFQVLDIICKCIGIPITLNSETHEKNLLVKLKLVFWISVRIILYFMPVFLLLNLKVEPLLKWLFGGYSLFSAMTMIPFVTNAKKLGRAIRNLISLHEEITPHEAVGSTRIQSHIAALSFMIAMITTALIVFFFVDVQEDVRWSISESIDFLFGETEKSYYVSATHAVLILSYVTNTATTCALSLICGHCYVAVAKVINDYGRFLGSRLNFLGRSKIDTRECLIVFKRVAFRTFEMESALSSGCLSLYGCSMAWFFQSLHLVVMSRTVPLTASLLTFYGATFGLSVYVFVLITLSASMAIAEHARLKRLVQKCPEMALGDNPAVSDDVIYTFQVGHLAEVVRDTPLHFTAGGMFVLHKGVVLKVAGIMVTYGVFLWQFEVMV